MYNGSTLRARNAESDFCLLELNTTPPPNSGLYYAGWSRSTTAAKNATVIHHPKGDLMKISRANDSVTVGSYGYSTNKHWKANWSPQNNGNGQTVTPITEGGSSGSPLFDQDHRIIGQLHGGPSYCGSSELWDFFGRFDLSWTGGGTPSTRLRDWLDPGNTNQLTTNTTNVASLNLSILAISGSPIVCNSSDYSILNLPAGAVVSWSISGSAGPVLQLSPNTPRLNQVRITNQKWYSINTTLTAIISNLGNGIPNETRVMTIVNDNSTSPTVAHSYFQEACTFYNVPQPYQSGIAYSNSSPVFVNQGCMVYVNLGDMTGRTVTLGSGGTPSFWGVGPTSYYPNTLYFQLPLGSGGIPFGFNINGNGACFQKTLLFFSKTSTSRYAFAAAPTFAKEQLVITVKENELDDLSNNKLSSKESKLQFTMNVYNIYTNKLLLTKRSDVGSMQDFLNVSNLNTGYYILQIINGTEKQSIKFFKE